jgi:hypothetical protein
MAMRKENARRLSEAAEASEVVHVSYDGMYEHCRYAIVSDINRSRHLSWQEKPDSLKNRGLDITIYGVYDLDEGRWVR